MIQIFLKPRKARALASRHPWVLDTSIGQIEGSPQDGDLVELLSDKRKFIGQGIYNSHSRIRVRLYTWNRSDVLDDAFWRRRIEGAIALRRHLGYNDPSGAVRLIFSEGDGLSGLIVDRYGDYLAVQATALGMALRLPQLVPILVDLLQPRGILVRTEKGMAKVEGIELRDGMYWGEPPQGPVLVNDGGLRWQVDLAEGQKTGFYLDQRENRQEAARHVAGRRVLDMFCYSGGFSLSAAALGKARQVTGYDSSEKAVVLARANAELNGVTNATFEVGEGFQVLESLVARQERFGTVILDPPKFTRSRQAIDEALRAYHWLNRLALSLVEPGGILVTCSCSGLVSREDFLDMLRGAAQQADRHVQVLQQRGAAADHPVAVNCPEGEYLKCFLCRVSI